MYLQKNPCTENLVLINIENGTIFEVEKESPEADYSIVMQTVGDNKIIVDDFSSEELEVEGCDMEQIAYLIPEMLLASLEGSHNKEELLAKYVLKMKECNLEELKRYERFMESGDEIDP